MQALRSTPSFADLRQSSTQHVLRTQRARPRIERPNTDDFELLGLAYSRLQQDAHSNEPTPSRTQHPSEERLLIHEDSRNASAELEHNQSDESGPCNTSTAGSCTTFLREIWLQLLWIHGSMLLVIITLVLIIVIFRVSSERSLFLEPTGWSYKKNKGILLINIPATWLTFVTARASQFALLLTAPLMELWTWCAAQALVEVSRHEDGDLPTPYQLSLLIGICMACVGRLRRWVSFRSCRKQKRHARRSSKVLLSAGRVMLLCLLLASLMFIADTIIHYTTQTIEYHKVQLANKLDAHGRGLSEACLTMDRVSNYGMPCSLNSLLSTDEYLSQQVEVLSLYHNTSATSELRTLAVDGQEMSVILPRTTKLSPYQDFRASTIGITTTCKPITQKCNLQAVSTNSKYTSFNCTPNLWGVIGKTANTSVYDPDYTPLSIKIGSNMVIAFFSDKELSIPYNTVGYDPATGDPDPNRPPMSDAELVNQVYMAFAARFSPTIVAPNTDLSLDAGFYKGINSVYEIVLNCSYKAMLVDYTWFNSSIWHLDIVEATNGTISEIWHGRNVPSSLSGDSPALQTILRQAAVQKSSIAFADTWATLYSTIVMDTIGGLTSSRLNLLEQERIPLLVIRVWIPALAFLGACCFGYIYLGSTLAASAVRIGIHEDVRDARARLSLYGLTKWAVDSQVNAYRRVRLLKEQDIGHEADRIGLFSGADNSFDFKVFDLNLDANRRNRIAP